MAAELSLDVEDPNALTDPRAVAAARTHADRCLAPFPGYAQIRALHLETRPWTVENGLLTPTLKLKRPALETRFADVIDDLYARHRQRVPDAEPGP
jgi:long-chain acyl-CoA synthetase